MTQCLRALAWWSELISLNTDDKGETWCCHFVHWQPPPPHIQMHGRLYTQTHMHTHIHIINKCFKYSRKFNICHLKTFKTSTLINLSASNIGQNSDMAVFFFFHETYQFGDSQSIFRAVSISWKMDTFHMSTLILIFQILKMIFPNIVPSLVAGNTWNSVIFYIHLKVLLNTEGTD